MNNHPADKCNKLNDNERSKVARDGTAWIDERVIARIKKRQEEVNKAREAYHVYEAATPSLPSED